MLRSSMRLASRFSSFLPNSRCFSTSNINNANVTLVGAAGGIGVPLSLLLKNSPYIVNLSLYDIKNVDGNALDLSHIDTSANVYGHSGPEKLPQALDKSDLVVITAGVPRKPGMTRQDLFGVNAKIIYEVLKHVKTLEYVPIIAIVTNPVNSMVPLAAKILEKYKKYDKYRLFGVTTLDVVRSNTFYAKLKGLDARDVEVPVVAGHSGSTIVPLFSQSNHPLTDENSIKKLVQEVQNAGTAVVEAKKDGSATLGMAYAANRFVNSVLSAYYGKEGVSECAYIDSPGHGDVRFFAEPVTLDQHGWTHVQSYDKILPMEEDMIKQAKVELIKDIKAAEELAEEFLKNEPIV